MRITVLDHDEERGAAACAALRAIGHHCTLGASAEVPALLAGGDEIDLLILDEACVGPSMIEQLKRAFPALPILFLSARSSEEDILAALAAGASDYLLKPMRQGEIVTRVQVLLKRTYPDQHAGALLRFGPYAFDTAASRITCGAKPIEVTRKECDLALLFFRNLGRPLSRTYIREVVWPGEAELPSRTLDTHVSRVRSKLGLRAENGYRLAPVYSFGYLLEQLHA